MFNISMAWNYFNPVEIVFQPIDNLISYVKGNKILLVTTPGFSRRGVAERIKQILSSREVIVWDKVQPNPGLDELDLAINQLQKEKIDFVIGLGGGSALDSAKVLACLLKSPPTLSLTKLLSFNENNTLLNRLPLLLMPTTAGTGSEVTPFATIWDRHEGKKHSLSGNFMYPDVALIDETLTFSLEREAALYPALDALSHALESLWNINKTPISQTFSYASLRLLADSLPKMELEEKNRDVKYNLLIGSMLAGLAISQTKTAIAHAISYPLTLNFKIPHGLACSFTLPFLIEKYLNENPSEKESLLLYKVQKIILDLNLIERIKKYVDYDEMLNTVEFGNLNSRLKNYSGGLNYSIKELLKKIHANQISLTKVSTNN